MKYRLLEAGETIKRGDEALFISIEGKTWGKTYRAGETVYTSGVYRRPIKKKKGSK